MTKKYISRKGKTLLLKILEVKGEPINLMYYAITKIAETYELTYEEVMSILMNFREDCLQKSMKEKFQRIIDFPDIENQISLKPKKRWIKKY